MEKGKLAATFPSLPSLALCYAELRLSHSYERAYPWGSDETPPEGTGGTARLVAGSYSALPNAGRPVPARYLLGS